MRYPDSWRLPAIFAALTIFSASISISYMDSFLGLSLFFGLIESVRRRSSLREIAAEIPAVFVAGAALFLWLIVSGILHWIWGGNLRDLSKGETGDLFLFVFGVHVFFVSRDDANRRIVMFGLYAFAFVILLSGLGAIFSEQRLAQRIYGRGFLSTALIRPQHVAGQIFGITLYRPIGFLATRLTFAGILVLIVPFLLFSIFQDRSRKSIAATLGGLLGLGLLFLNGTRSALLGLAAGCAVYFAVRVYERSRRVFFLCATAVLLAGIVLHSQGSDDAIAGRQTDYQRPILWTGALEAAKEHPLFGVGPNHFREAALAWREKYALEHPMAWYYLETTPSGHAHNDILNMAAIGGAPAAVLFLALVALSLRNLEPGSSTSARSRWMAVGIAGFFAAGLGQCYYQDDSVVIIYWTLLALSTGESSKAAEESTG